MKAGPGGGHNKEGGGDEEKKREREEQTIDRAALGSRLAAVRHSSITQSVCARGMKGPALQGREYQEFKTMPDVRAASTNHKSKPKQPIRPKLLINHPLWPFRK